MTVLRKQRATYPFVMTPVSVVKDTSISSNALRLYIYMLSLPDGWVFYSNVIKKNTGLGRDSYRAAMNQLIEKSLIKRHQKKSSGSGKFENYDYEIIIPGGESPPVGSLSDDDDFPQNENGEESELSVADDNRELEIRRRETRPRTGDGFSGPIYILKDLNTYNEVNKEKKKLKQKDLAINNTKTGQSPDDGFLDFFNFYKAEMEKPRSKPTQALRSKYNARRGDGFSDDELRRAVMGCKLSKWHQGDNPQGTRYNGLELILRSPDKVYDFIARHEASSREDTRDSEFQFTSWEELAARAIADDAAGKHYGPDGFDDGKTIDGEWE